MVWKKGQSGNPTGWMGNAKLYRQALLLELEATEGDLKKLREIAKVQISRCKAGDIAAIKELADRVDGKVPQAIVNDEGDSPMLIVVRWGDKEIANDDNNEIPLLELKANGSTVPKS